MPDHSVLVAGLAAAQLTFAAFAPVRQPPLDLVAASNRNAGRDAGGTQTAAAPQKVETEPPEIATTLADLHTALSRMTPTGEGLVAAHRRASAALNGLRELSTGWPAQSPATYRRSLRNNLAVLQAALGRDRAVQTRVIEAVADDLEAKLEHCRASGGRLGGAVTVRVRTLQGDAEARNWRVLYLPKILELTNAAPDVFPRLSSPTEETFVPGRYVMWVRNPVTGAISDRVVVKVGEGKSELTVDLTVPADRRP